MGTKLLARQLRYEDDKEETLMFYAAASTPAMFSAVKGLVRDTIGDAGLAEQLRHNSAMGVNVLMKASNDEEVSSIGEPAAGLQVAPPQVNGLLTPFRTQLVFEHESCQSICTT